MNTQTVEQSTEQGAVQGAAPSDSETQNVNVNVDASPPPSAAPEQQEDWRVGIARTHGAGDEEATQRELQRLQRFADPAAMYGAYREMESNFSRGGLVRVPGENATEDEVSRFRTAMGVPEDASEYMDAISLENGATIGEADAPLVQIMAEVAHEGHTTPANFNALVNKYYELEQEQMEQLIETDSQYRSNGESELRREWGDRYKANMNLMTSAFSLGEGGVDMDNPGSTIARMLTARTQDGRVIGDDPQMTKFFYNIARAVNPRGAVEVTAPASGMTLEQEIRDIEGMWRDPVKKKQYFDDPKLQARYRELIEAQERAS